MSKKGSVKNRRTRRFNKKQLCELLKYLKHHPDLASGRFSKYGNEKEWQKVANILSDFGPSKSAEKWKTVWRDLRTRCRQKMAAISNAKLHTTDKNTELRMTSTDREVLRIMGLKTVLGLENVNKTAENDQELSTDSFPEVTDTLSEMKLDIEDVYFVMPEPSTSSDPFSPHESCEESKATIPSKKMKRTLEIDELTSAAKKFEGIQNMQNSALSDIAAAINRLAAAQEAEVAVRKAEAAKSHAIALKNAELFHDVLKSNQKIIEFLLNDGNIK